MTSKNYFLPLILICIFFSCKKESESPIWTQEHLIDSEWVITSNILKSNTLDPDAIEVGDVTFSDVWEIEPDCTKDDTYRFNSDKSFEKLSGLNGCTETDNHSFPQTWQITPEGYLKVIKTTSSAEELIIWEFQLIKYGDDFFEVFNPTIFLGALQEYHSVSIIRFEKVN